MRSREQTTQPLAEPGVASAQCRQSRSSTLDQHLPQVFAAAFGNPEQARFASVVACRGTSPSHAARLRPRAKVSASPTAATSAVALSAPMPGMLVSRRAASSRFASAANSASNAAILSSSASHRVSMSAIRRWIRELRLVRRRGAEGARSLEASVWRGLAAR
jgi:hypothetical protein